MGPGIFGLVHILLDSLSRVSWSFFAAIFDGFQPGV